MSGVLYNRGQQSRNTGAMKNELQECLAIIETLRELDSPYDCDREDIYIAGSVNLTAINRMRAVAGMKPLPAACVKCHAATKRACICDPMNMAGVEE